MQPKSKSTAANMVNLDGEFIDFWNDALLDPVSNSWPHIAVAQLKSIPDADS